MMMSMADQDLATPDTAAPIRRRSAPEPAAPRWRRRLVVLGLVLAAVNLRPTVTSLGPLLEEARA
ncbi:MFS transporter, partial [Streptomyces sp. 2MCAF27]